MLIIGLAAIILLVLVLPLTVHFVERNIEAFLLVMGLAAVSVSHLFSGEAVWTGRLVEEALREPLLITAAVAVFGFLVYLFHDAITRSIAGVERRLGLKTFSFLLIVGLGLLSSAITAIIAAIILVEVVSALKFDKQCETHLVILGCFSIGLGAALTPVGEPLATIAIAKLRGEPYHAHFFFLVRHLGPFILPGIVGLGIYGALIEPSKVKRGGATLVEKEHLTRRDVVLRAVRVYIFIAALVLLGTGFKPFIDRYVIQLSGHVLYWLNTVSAVLDNATLTAAEVSPRMSIAQIRYVLMGLLIAGGMLIPGNIPNIIAAGRLSIGSKEWARLGVPLGFVIMLIYFGVFLIV